MSDERTQREMVQDALYDWIEAVLKVVGAGIKIRYSFLQKQKYGAHKPGEKKLGTDFRLNGLFIEIVLFIR